MPSSKIVSRPRLDAFNRQSGRCYYCSAEMWLSKPHEFAHKHGLTLAQAGRFKCTAEHLVARCDGGRNGAENIAAACVYCNSQRHRPKVARSPEQHKAYIRKRIANGGWHPRQLHHLLATAKQSRNSSGSTVDAELPRQHNVL